MEAFSNISSTYKDTSLVFSFFSSESYISFLGFSHRSFKALIKNGYDTIGKIITLDKESLMAIRNLGKKSIKEILTIRKQLLQQHISVKENSFINKNAMSYRIIDTSETIYPTDYIGILDISLKAHNVLYNAGIFTVGKLFSLEKEAIYKLKNTNRQISEELCAFIAREKPLVGKISGDEDIDNYTEKITQIQQNYRMSILEKIYKNIPQNRLDKPLNLYLQEYDVKNIKNSITSLLLILKKGEKISTLKNTFPAVAKTSRTNDIARILELLSFNFIKFLNKTFEPFLSNHFYTNSLKILSQRASGLTLRDIAEKSNVTYERIRQIELKSSNKLISIIKNLPINIISFICTETGNSEYISSAVIQEYLTDFKYCSHVLYLLKNENIYKKYQYNKKYDVFYRSGLKLDFSSLNIQKHVKELSLKNKDLKTGKKIEDFLIAKNPAKCTYNDISDFIAKKTGYPRLWKIIQLTNNIVEIEENLYMHKSCIIDYDQAAEKLLFILKNQFNLFYGYSDSHILFEAACVNLEMFMNANGFKTEPIIYMLAKHIFFKEKYGGHKFFFTKNFHIWEKKTNIPQNSKGLFINLAKATGGIIFRKETEKYLENLKIPKNAIIKKLHNVKNSTFYFYKDTTYVLSEYLQIDNIFLSKIKKTLNKLFGDKEYIIPRIIDKAWFETLPILPLKLSWNLLLLQEIMRYNEGLGFKPLFPDLDQSPYRISGAFVRTSSDATLVDIIYAYTKENRKLPYRNTTENYRKLLRKEGFIHGSEWFTGMHKIFNDNRFVFSNNNKNILIL